MARCLTRGAWSAVALCAVALGGGAAWAGDATCAPRANERVPAQRGTGYSLQNGRVQLAAGYEFRAPTSTTVKIARMGAGVSADVSCSCTGQGACELVIESNGALCRMASSGPCNQSCNIKVSIPGASNQPTAVVDGPRQGDGWRVLGDRLTYDAGFVVVPEGRSGATIRAARAAMAGVRIDCMCGGGNGSCNIETGPNYVRCKAQGCTSCAMKTTIPQAMPSREMRAP